MTTVENDKELDFLRSQLVGPEKNILDVTKKVDVAVELLSHLESVYQDKRKQQSLLPPIWFNRNAIIISVATVGLVLSIGILFSFFYHIQIDLSKMVVPLSIRIGIVPLIIFSAQNNYNYQKMNAELSRYLSGMMNIRSKITLLQEKELELRSYIGWQKVTPFEIRRDIITELQKIRSYLNSLIEIPEYKSGNIEESELKARPIISKANEEFIPKWIELAQWSEHLYADKRMNDIYGQFVNIITNPKFVDFKKIERLKKVTENILSKYKA